MIKIQLTDRELALAESLYDSLQESNALGYWHAREDGGSYGAIKVALLTTIMYGFIGADKGAIGADERDFGRRVATIVYCVAVEQGCTIEEAIREVEPRWCYDCARFLGRFEVCNHRIEAEEKELEALGYCDAGRQGCTTTDPHTHD